MGSGMSLACFGMEPSFLLRASNTDLSCLTCDIALILFLWTLVQLSQAVLLCSKSNNQLFRADIQAVFQKIT